MASIARWKFSRRGARSSEFPFINWHILFLLEYFVNLKFVENLKHQNHIIPSRLFDRTDLKSLISKNQKVIFKSFKVAEAVQSVRFTVVAPAAALLLLVESLWKQAVTINIRIEFRSCLHQFHEKASMMKSWRSSLALGISSEIRCSISSMLDWYWYRKCESKSPNTEYHSGMFLISKIRNSSKHEICKFDTKSLHALHKKQILKHCYSRSLMNGSGVLAVVTSHV